MRKEYITSILLKDMYYARMIHQQRWMPRLRALWFCQRSTATWHWAFRTLCSQISPRAWNRCTTLRYMDSYGGNGKAGGMCLSKNDSIPLRIDDQRRWCDRWMCWWYNASKGCRAAGKQGHKELLTPVKPLFDLELLWHNWWKCCGATVRSNGAWQTCGFQASCSIV